MHDVRECFFEVHGRFWGINPVCGKGHFFLSIESNFRQLSVIINNLEWFRVHYALWIHYARRRRGWRDRNTCAKEARKALRVIPRGKHRLTVYRAHQVEIFMKFRVFSKVVGQLLGRFQKEYTTARNVFFECYGVFLDINTVCENHRHFWSTRARFWQWWVMMDSLEWFRLNYAFSVQNACRRRSFQDRNVSCEDGKKCSTSHSAR